MAVYGIGKSGYIRAQKETTYGTGLTDSMTDLCIKAGSKAVGMTRKIENELICGDRLMNEPNSGNKENKFNLIVDCAPGIMGLLHNLFLGAATTGVVADSLYTHIWLCPTSGVRVGTSSTLQSAIGANLADQFDGCTITKMIVRGRVNENLEITLEGVAQTKTSDVARVSSFTYPSDAPFNLSHLVADINPNGASNFTQDLDEFELTLDLTYDGERFKSGSTEITQPVFNAIPSVSLSLTHDADPKFQDYADALTDCFVTLTFTHTILVGTSSVYAYEVELPKCYIEAESQPDFAPEYLKQTTVWNCGAGAASTDSSSVEVMFQVKVEDGTATYTA